MTDPIHRRLRRTLANKLIDFLQEGEPGSEVDPDDAEVGSAAVEDEASSIKNKKELSLGYVRLTDSAPLIVAAEQGFFAAQGLSVSLVQEASWASIRDKVTAGMLDGAQMPATMPLASTLGAAGPQHAMAAPYTLSCGGNAITLSRQLFRDLCDIDGELQSDMNRAGAALKRHIEKRRQSGKSPLTLAMVFSTSTHSYLLRHWLAAARIDPDRDVRLTVIPPSQMADNLACGNIAGFCAGEPWNSKAIAERSGIAVATSSALWAGHPEKVLGFSQRWLQQNSGAAELLIKALSEASKWLTDPDHRRDVAELLARPEWLNQPVDLIERSVNDQFLYAPEVAATGEAFHQFGPELLNRPDTGAGQWWLAQMYRWGHLHTPVSFTSAVSTVYDDHLFSRALGQETSVSIASEVGPSADRLRLADPLQYLLDCEVGIKPGWLSSALNES